MSSPKNIQRDGIFTDLEATHYNWATATTTTGDTVKVNGDPSVYVDKAFVKSDRGATCAPSATTLQAIGCFIQQPIGDRTPYRVKVSCPIADADGKAFIVIGYAPASPSGSDDILAANENALIPFENTFDDLIIIPSLPEGDALEDRALCFGIAVTGAFSEQLPAHLSVQNLGVKPPTMHNSIS